MKNKLGKIIFKIASVFLIIMLLLLIINISTNKIVEISMQTEEKVRAIEEQQTAINKKITDLKEGEYIKYDTGVTTVGDNGVITCVVLYDSTSLYGIQIISIDTVGKEIKIGDKNNFNKAVEEHNNAITKLNNEANKYLNTKYSTSARCVGSVPNNPNSETNTYYKGKEIWAKPIGGILKDKDNNYFEDSRQMSKLGIKFIGKPYWLASRGSEATENLEKCIIKMIEYKEGFYSFSTAVCGIWAPSSTHGNIKYSGQANYGLRPCFTLKNDILITGGDGKSEETAYIINNFDINEKKEITVEKIWNDNNNIAGKRPESIILKVMENGTEVLKKEVTSEENWSHTFELPKYNSDGTEKVYTIDEEAKNINDLYFYTKTINGNVITNTFKVPTENVEITVNKQWVDTEQQKVHRPDNITIQILNGQTVVQEKTISNNQEETTFTLPKYDENGNEIIYTISEIQNSKYYISTINQETKVITNSFKTPDEQANIIVKKIWNDDNNIIGIRPEQIELTLVANGVETQRKVIVNEQNNWSSTLTDLNKYEENGNEIVYTVTEKEVPSHYTKEENGLTVTNTIDYESMMKNVILKKYEEGTTIGLEGAIIEISNELGNSIKVTTDENGEALFRVVPGKYQYKEIKAPNGYILNSEKYNFILLKDGTIIFEENTNGIIYNKKDNQPDKPDIPDNPNTPDKPVKPDTPDKNVGVSDNDTTKTDGKLPQTGETLNFAIIIISLIIICIYNFIKIKNIKEIK